MQNVVLTIHLILAVLLTGVVLLQRSEGGGLGMGGGGGAGGVMTGRQAANALTRLTWIFGIAIFCTSLGLTVIAARQSANSSIMDQIGAPESQQETPASTLPELPAYTPPPSTGGDPLTPPAPDAPAATTPAPAAEAPADAAPASDAVTTPPAPEAPAEAAAGETAPAESDASQPAN